MSDAQRSAIAEFRRLHESGCFVLPNPWDVGTALYLQHLGYKALEGAAGQPSLRSRLGRALRIDG